MPDQRQAVRTRVLMPAKLFYDQRWPAIQCIVHNLSIGGACLEVSSPVKCPETFELSFDSFRSARRVPLAMANWKQGRGFL